MQSDETSRYFHNCSDSKTLKPSLKKLFPEENPTVSRRDGSDRRRNGLPVIWLNIGQAPVPEDCSLLYTI